MINRVLIRIKVVQMLYSYLLTENQFALESQPSAPTKEKRFAYLLYLDTLYLIVRIADKIEKKGGYRPLADTRFVRRILTDDRMRSLVKKYQEDGGNLEAIASQLTEAVKESAIYKNYLKDLNAGKTDDAVWKKIFDRIIAVSPEWNAMASARENYTVSGVERMREMASQTFSNFFASADIISDALGMLEQSLEKTRELYFRLLLLPVDLVALRERQLDENRYKYILTDEDVNPNLRFVENALVKRIAADPEVISYCEKNHLGWLADDRQTLESLLKVIMDSDIYKEYMSFPATDLHRDCEFWKDIFRYVILPNPDFLESLEDKSVFWNDDLDIISTFVIKTFRKFEKDEDEVSSVLPKYKDEEDARFGADLFADVIRKKDYYRSLISEAVDTGSWDIERLAFMDVIIIMTAVAEIINYPKIPLNATINEYIDIAKRYSTGKSGIFVHGLLGAIVTRLREEGKIDK